VHENSIIKDIRDGEEFMKVKSECTGKYDITLLWNTDGVDLSESSHVKMWPVQAVICEVPYYLRPKFTFVCLVWIEHCKPKMNMYLKPFVKSLIDLWENGVDWTHPITKEKIVSKVVAPVLSADAPATADVLNIQDVTAIYGCNLCEQEASPAPAIIKRKDRIVRRFTYHKESAQLRTGERMKVQALNAKRMKKPYLGVKGRSVVRKIPLFDIGSSVPIDYMHCVLLGVVKRFTKLWFFVKSVVHERDWYIGDRLEDANKFISDSVKVPDFVTREPRGLDVLDDWKASELLTWLLYHSLPVLIFLEMPTPYVKHHMLLVRAIFILLKDRISEPDLDEAQRLVSRYVEQVGSLYRKQDLVYNVHSLLHLPLCVRRWGPLFATSAFRFEDFNGTLASMVHGTKHQAKEFVTNLNLARGICGLKWKVEQSRCETARGIVRLEKIRAASQDEMIPLRENNIVSVEVYDRCDYQGLTLTSRTYDEKVARANSFVLVRNSPVSLNPGQILIFFRMSDGVVFCTLEMFRLSYLEVLVNFTPPHLCRIEHLIPIDVNGKKEKLVCDLSSIAEKLVKAGNFVCRRPNKFEKNL